MRRIFKDVLLIISIFIFMIQMVPSSMGNNDSLAIFMFIEDKAAYVEGDVVSITIHVFDKGMYLEDPDNITLTVNDTKEIPLTKIGSGIFQGSYKMSTSDAKYSYSPSVYFQANVTYGLNFDSTKDSIYVFESEEDGAELFVEITTDDPRDLYPRPGDVVELTVEVRINNFLATPDTIEISHNFNTLDFIEYSTGIYKATYTVDSDIKTYTEIMINAGISYNEKSWEDRIVLTIDFLNVWIHNIVRDGNDIEAEFWVSDLKGMPVSDAEINILNLREWIGTYYTNENGMADVSFTGYSYPFIFFWRCDCIVRSPNGFTQEFAFYIPYETSSNGPSPAADKLDVFLQDKDYYIKPNEVEYREYEAYYDKSLWKNSPIYYYVVFQNGTVYPDGGYMDRSDGLILKHDIIETDNYGKFELNFTAPNYQGNIDIYFEAGVEYSDSTNDNLSYSRDSDTFCYVRTKEIVKNQNIVIDMEDLILGKNVTISADPGDLERNIGKITWEVEDIYWSQEGGIAEVYMEEDGDSFTGSISLAEFLPLDKQYIINVSFTNPDTGVTNYNYIIRTPIGKASDMDDDGLPDVWEQEHFGNLDYGPDQDPDKDGLTNLQELNNQTNPNKKDTEEDGMPDGWEIDNGFDPLYDDSEFDEDWDGFTNLKEYKGNSDPNDETSFPKREYNTPSQYAWIVLIIIIVCILLMALFLLGQRRKKDPQHKIGIKEYDSIYPTSSSEEPLDVPPPPPEYYNNQ